MEQLVGQVDKAAQMKPKHRSQHVPILNVDFIQLQ